MALYSSVFQLLFTHSTHHKNGTIRTPNHKMMIFFFSHYNTHNSTYRRELLEALKELELICFHLQLVSRLRTSGNEVISPEPNFFFSIFQQSRRYAFARLSRLRFFLPIFCRFPLSLLGILRDCLAGGGRAEERKEGDESNQII